MVVLSYHKDMLSGKVGNTPAKRQCLMSVCPALGEAYSKNI